MLSLALRTHLEHEHAISITSARALSGGDINEAAMMELADGKRLFIKYNEGQDAAEMFRCEALGLALLGAPRVIQVAKTRGRGEAPGGPAYLLLDYIEQGTKNKLFWEALGRQLADLHGVTAAQFGFAHDNYIGSLPQRNRRHDSWATFFAEERLRPQIWLARHQNRLEATDNQALERLCRKLGEICPEELPAMIHGDLWSGNVLCDQVHRPVLIDPAACFAHREQDLAMADLFGGFHPAFFSSYMEYWPLEPEFDKRKQVYQLYYLLVHVNLFGGGYIEKVRAILKHY